MSKLPRAFFASLFLVPLILLAGCSRPQPTEEEVAGQLSPPLLRTGPNLPGGVSESPTAAGAGGSAAAGTQFDAGRMGGPLEQPTVAAPTGAQINVDTGHRMSPSTEDGPEGDSSSGSGSGSAGNPIPPNVVISPPDPTDLIVSHQNAAPTQASGAKKLKGKKLAGKAGSKG